MCVTGFEPIILPRENKLTIISNQINDLEPYFVFLSQKDAHKCKVGALGWLHVLMINLP